LKAITKRKLNSTFVRPDECKFPRTLDEIVFQVLKQKINVKEGDKKFKKEKNLLENVIF
jgi:hypothetical protein